VRKYDLRSSPSLQQGFRGAPVSGFSDADFSNVAHLQVPVLSDDEVHEMGRQSPALARAIHSASAALRRLICVPFNMRLLAEIVEMAGPEVELREIHTDIELLERYWSARVLREDLRGDAREIVLRRACEAMISTRRLTVERHLVVDSASTQDLPDLLSANVLSEWQPPGYTSPVSQTLLFSHHTLFDFAASRLLLRGHPDAMAERLENEPDLVLMIQPSLRYHLRYLWFQAPDREVFWQLCLDLARRAAVPETAKVIGPAVATSLILDAADCWPLVAALRSTDMITRKAGERCLDHLVGAVLSGDNPRETLLANDSPWPEIVEQVSAELSPASAYSLRRILLEMTEEAGQ
jgi:hypothetical protein